MSVPRHNGQVVGQGLARLTSAFVAQPNIRAMLTVYLTPFQQLEDVYFDILESRVLSTATCYPISADPDAPLQNVVFDSLGTIVGLSRGGPVVRAPSGALVGLTDTLYKALLYLEIAVNRSTGRMTDWSRFAQILTPWAAEISFLQGTNADFAFTVLDITLPPVTVASQLAKATPNGVGGAFVWTTWDPSLDLLLSDSYDGDHGQDSGQGGLGAYPYANATPATGPAVTGYSLWLDGAFAGNTSSTWADRSGNSRNGSLVTIGAGTAPLTPAAVNGLSAYGFAGTYGDQYYETPAYPSFANVTVFAAVVVGDVGGANGGVVQCNSTNQYVLDFGSGGFGGIEGYAGGSDIVGTGSPSGLGAVAVLCLTTNATSDVWFLYQNGTLIGTTSYNFVSTGNVIRLLGKDSAFTGELFSGFLCEIVEYPSELSGSDRANVEAYLTAKWTQPPVPTTAPGLMAMATGL